MNASTSTPVKQGTMSSIATSQGNGSSRPAGTPLTYLLASGAGLIVGAGVTFWGHFRATQEQLRKACEPGRAVSAQMTATDGLPLTTLAHNGKAGDPLNVQIEGTEGQVNAAFASAGWYRADETDMVTALRISADSLVGRPYSTAPCSNLYLFGRKEDLVFERPASSVRQRDHIRLWNTGQQTEDGRPRWIGSGTKDVKVELKKTNHMPTHEISPDVDSERELVVSELAQTGFIVNDTQVAGFGHETHGHNGGGDPYDTDGQVAVLTLANFWTPPVPLQVRGPVGGQIGHQVGTAVRRFLPEEGRKRAEREIAKVNQQASTSPAAPSGK
jgi:LssY C-terminus